MGSGDFGSDGSVHWDIAATSAPSNGVDTLKKHPDRPGADPRPVIGAPPHPRSFQVTMRFTTIEAAQDALKGVGPTPAPGGGFEVVVLVPVRPYQTTAGPKNRWEVSVDW
jgi:hypothetical protein